LPGADRVFERSLALPYDTRLTEADVDRVVPVLAHVL
jgi:dTDP-4-amino-4,6-dideoxygalactose transaminase